MRTELITTYVWIYKNGTIFYLSRVKSMNLLNFREGKERSTDLNA